MKTDHKIVTGDARSMAEIDDNAVDLVVTSPPYPMIEMWDELFAELEPDVDAYLEDGDGQAAFEAMHAELDRVWEEVSRVLVDGGIACVNVGDATRKLEESFRVYQNHSAIVESFEELGFEPLPEILWRKPNNSGAKFMGSGMLPPNAYVTLEHEYILVFRNGTQRREFEPRAETRYESSYLWEERNRWFTDLWDDVTGTEQMLPQQELRDRSAAYPIEIPYRLVNMFSTYTDTVCDPFLGTGTTSIAAAAAGRNSIGYEIADEFTQLFKERIGVVPSFASQRIEKRFEDHAEFVQQRDESGEEMQYEADNYDMPVMTQQEQPIQFYGITDHTEIDSGYRFFYEPIESPAAFGTTFDWETTPTHEVAELSEF